MHTLTAKLDSFARIASKSGLGTGSASAERHPWDRLSRFRARRRSSRKGTHLSFEIDIGDSDANFEPSPQTYPALTPVCSGCLVPHLRKRSPRWIENLVDEIRSSATLGARETGEQWPPCGATRRLGRPYWHIEFTRDRRWGESPCRDHRRLPLRGLNRGRSGPRGWRSPADLHEPHWRSEEFDGRPSHGEFRAGSHGPSGVPTAAHRL